MVHCAARSFFGSRSSVAHPRQAVLFRGPRRRVRPGFSRSLTVRVENNELNKWGDTSGGDEDAGAPELGFEKDIALIVSKLLTAKAVQHILGQLGQTDRLSCQWFNNFVAENPPMRGDDFVLKLMRQKPETVACATSGETKEISPQMLGNRVLKMREGLAGPVCKLVPKTVSDANMKVLRKHIESTSYTSGSGAPQKPQRGRDQGRSRGRV